MTRAVDDRETLGSRIRALRLGYGWVPEISRYMRISDNTPGEVTVEIRRACSIPSAGAPGGMHRCWWERDTQGGHTPAYLLAIVKDLDVGVHHLSADMETLP